VIAACDPAQRQEAERRAATPMPDSGAP